MPLQSSGQIDFSDINVELGLTSTAQISLGGAATRALYGVSSGAIRLAADGYGKSNTLFPNGVATAAAPILYQFTNTADSWTAAGATLTNGANALTINSTGIDPIIRRTVSFSGSKYPYIQINIFRTSGTTWDGKVFYSTSGHGESGLFYMQIPEPTWDGVNYQPITLDMRSLTVGGADWTNNTITNVRLDFGAAATDDFLLDYVQFRGDIYPVAGLYQYSQAGYYADNVNFFTASSIVAVGTTNNISSTLGATTTSYQYIGYFLAPTTAIYNFGIASDDAGYLWIGDTAITGYTASNAIVAQPGLRGAAYTNSGNISLTAGVYYPIRFITGNNTGSGGQFLQWRSGVNAYTTDGTGEYFYNADVGITLNESYTINVTNVGSSSYSLSGTDRNGAVSGNNPTISFNSGDIVNFVVNASGHPFWVKTAQVTGTGSGVVGVNNNGAQVGTVSWTASSSGTFYYICQFHSAMVGTITVT
jgi:plastocyanin